MQEDALIVSFTPNPAVDKTLLVESLRYGEVNRVRDSHLDPGGKGINVSRMVHRLGRPTMAVSILGGHMGKLLRRGLRAEGVPCRMVWVLDDTRLNVILVDESTGRATKVWDRGPPVPENTAERVLAVLDRVLVDAKVLVAGGTMPPGLSEGFYRQVIDMARERGTKTILDADIDAFRDGLTGRPDLIKPNVEEAERLLGRKLPDRDAVIAGARDLLVCGTDAVVISMGAEGSILATHDDLVLCRPPRVDVRSTVGSGDSLVAGLAIALAEGRPLREGLQLGTAAGAATAATVGTALGDRHEIHRLLPEVVIEDL